MKKIDAVALLYTIAAMPAFASEDYSASGPDAPEALRNAILDKIRAKADRLSTFSLVELDGNFSLYGKLYVPRLTHGDETGGQRNAATYGLHGQFGGARGAGIKKMGFRIGWNRYLAGPNTGENIYSLTAEVRF